MIFIILFSGDFAYFVAECLNGVDIEDGIYILYDNGQTLKSCLLYTSAGVAAGVRRIEALTGPSVTAYYKAQEEKMHEAAALLKTTPADLLEKIARAYQRGKALLPSCRWRLLACL